MGFCPARKLNRAYILLKLDQGLGPTQVALKKPRRTTWRGRGFLKGQSIYWSNVTRCVALNCSPVTRMR